MVQKPLNQTWDLDVFFPGGSKSPEFRRFLDDLAAGAASLKQRLEAGSAPATVAELEGWTPLLGEFQDLAQRNRQAGAFISCLTAQDMADEEAKLLQGRMTQIRAALSSATTLLDHQISQMPEEVFTALVERPEFADIAYPLRERRARAGMRMDPERESLAGDLAVDGYHAWGRLYNELGRPRPDPLGGGGPDRPPVGGPGGQQAARPRPVRCGPSCSPGGRRPGASRRTFRRRPQPPGRFPDSALPAPGLGLGAHRAPGQQPDEGRNAGGHVGGRRPQQDHLCRVPEPQGPLLGSESWPGTTWTAPLGARPARFSYDDAADFVRGALRPLLAPTWPPSPERLRERWIEAEDRPGKRPGGFCTSFPLAGQSRIFMTFGGTMDNVSTLAHELGHAYHQSVMNDLPQLAQGTR